MKNQNRLTTFLGVGVMLAVAAGVAPLTADKYQPITVKDGGTIKGVVTFDGVRESPEEVTVTTKEDVCHSEPIYSEKLVVSEDLGVRWAVVSIQGIAQGKDFVKSEDPEKQPTIDQNGCTFRPHILTVAVGESVRVLNSDGVLHNVHTWPKKNRSKNMAMPGMIKELALRFRRAERIRVTCDIHPWMEAWIVATDHPYVEVTDEKGEFTLKDVPAGTYTLKLWHETLGEFSQEVTVTAGSEASVEFLVAKQDD